jgi:hypothetical protein
MTRSFRGASARTNRHPRGNITSRWWGYFAPIAWKIADTSRAKRWLRISQINPNRLRKALPVEIFLDRLALMPIRRFTKPPCRWIDSTKASRIRAFGKFQPRYTASSERKHCKCSTIFPIILRHSRAAAVFARIKFLNGLSSSPQSLTVRVIGLVGSRAKTSAAWATDTLLAVRSYAAKRMW